MPLPIILRAGVGGVPQKLFLNGFGDPSVARKPAGTRISRSVDRFERLGRQPKVDAIKLANRTRFRRVVHNAKLAPFWRHVYNVRVMFSTSGVDIRARQSGSALRNEVVLSFLSRAPDWHIMP